jgi:AcrR family transcriptional regulator
MTQVRSRRERPAKPALSRPGIVTAAVALMRAEGLERVTMRRLADQLDTGPASLYVYVRDTADLHAAVLEEMLGQVDLAPAHGGGDWRERLTAVLRSYLGVLFEHPGLARSALVARPTGPNALALIESLLVILEDGDVPGPRAAWAVDLLLHFATATAAEQSTRTNDPAMGQQDEDMAVALRSASPAAYPRISALQDELLAGPGADRLAWGFAVLIDGIVHTGRPPAT